MIDIPEKAKELRAQLSNMSAGTISDEHIEALQETARQLVEAIEEWYATAAVAAAKPAAQPATAPEPDPVEVEPEPEEEEDPEPPSHTGRGGRGGRHR
jgi:hypothetical protein